MASSSESVWSGNLGNAAADAGQQAVVAAAVIAIIGSLLSYAASALLGTSAGNGIALVTYLATYILWLRNSPPAGVAAGYLAFISATVYVAAISIESGGYLYESDVTGQYTGSFARLLALQAIFWWAYFFTTIKLNNNGLRSKSSDILTLEDRKYSIWIAVLVSLACLASGVLAGVLDGFATLKGVNRYAIRNAEDSSAGSLFNFYLNNRTFATIVGGLLISRGITHSLTVKSIGMGIIFIAATLSFLHGEQFMATIQLLLSSLIPIAYLSYLQGTLNLRRLGSLVVVAAAIGLASLIAAYEIQGYNISEMIEARFVLQGQLWYLVDTDAGLFHPPSSGGWPSIYKFIQSLLELDAPSYELALDKISGLRDLMYSYANPQLMYTMEMANVTFTMGQFAVPAYWFGLVPSIVFIVIAAVTFAFVVKCLNEAIAMGGVITIFIAAKLFGNTTFGLQQGEYWYVFGPRSVPLIFLGFWLLRWTRSGKIAV